MYLTPAHVCIAQGKDHKTHTTDLEKRLNKFSIVNNTKSKKKKEHGPHGWHTKGFPWMMHKRRQKPIGKGKVP